MEAMVRQRECKIGGEPPTIEVEMEDGEIKTLKAAKDCTLLGAILNKNIQWQSHIGAGNEAILPILRKRIGMLKILGKEYPHEK